MFEFERLCGLCLRFLALLALGIGTTCVAAPAAPATAATGGCGGFPRADNGPYDYRTVQDHRLKIVEQYHFTPNVEALVSGNSTANVGGELSFTLRAFPNHHRALVSMVRLGDKLKTAQPPGAMFSVDCWLERATRFAVDDPIARMLRASWLGKKGRQQEALEQLKVADVLAGDNGFTVHNVGLVYLELGEYELALSRAHKAAVLGLQRTTLRDALKSAGKWREPDPVPSAPAASEAASAPAGGG
ncbi:hypothetical protein BurJ1DRAFT_3180 [Burkholderiales bacterium JOSHI_001]|nr:hypothetical protein BurJ1DRAFT_3180 [Burkholderiales bacterium JOSHI_001]